jgi:peptidyl-prolyl cis-trans isomerase D
MQAIRTRAGSLIVKALFAVLIISFGFWGIYTRSPFYESSSPDTVVATVGDQSISAGEVQQTLQPTVERLRRQLGTAIDSQQIKQLGILDGTLTQLIDRSLLDQAADRLGLAVSDTVIRDTIYGNPAFHAPDGQFDRQRFEQVLAANRITEPQLVQRLRHDIPRTDLLQAVTAGIAVPRPVADAIYRYRNEKRVADIVAFPASGVANVGQPSEAELTEFYHAHEDQFRAPEYRTLTVASLVPADLEQSAPIAEDKLKQAYDQRRDEFQTPEKRDIQQILAPNEKKAEEAEAALKAGQDWQQVATKIAGQSADTIDLGLLSRKEIPQELADDAFQLPINQPSKPIKTPLGWHILRIVKIVPAAVESFAEAKPKLEANLKLQDAVNRLDKIGNEADDALAGGATLAEAAKKYGLKTTTVTVDESGHDRAGKAVSLPVAVGDVLKTAFATNQGDTSRITDTDDGSIYTVHVDQVTPPAVRPLAGVKNQATALWQAEQRREAAAKESKALAASVKPDLPLAKAAAGKGLLVRSGVSLTRSGEPPKSVPPELVQKLFAAKPGAVVAASDASGAYTAQLNAIDIPKAVPDTAARQLSDQLDDAAKLDVAGQFAAALRRYYPVDIKREALDRMF